MKNPRQCGTQTEENREPDLNATEGKIGPDGGGARQRFGRKHKSKGNRADSALRERREKR
jgi:hypothetical protein